MEENNLTNDDFDSVATAVYQAIDDSPSQRMDFESENQMLRPEEVNEDDEEVYDEDEMDEMDDCTKSPLTNDYHNLSPDHNSNDDDNDAVAEPEVDKERVNCVLAVNQNLMAHNEEYDGLDIGSLEHLRFEEDNEGGRNDVSPRSKNAIVHPAKADPLIFHDDGGKIKKITISNTKSKPSTKVLKVKTSTQVASSDEKLPKQQRSSTPFSREYLALQKSVNESKVLTEFVTGASVVKNRKMRTKKSITPGNTPSTPTSTDHSYSSKLWRSNPSTPDMDAALRIMNRKRQKKIRYLPLKEEAAVNATNAVVADKFVARSSRSRSMYNNFSDNSNSSTTSKHKKRSRSVQKYDSDCSTHSVLNNWPSDENVTVAGSGSFKRTNMRSKNSDFVQKQKEFLQRVINSTQDTPQRRSRSRSDGRDSLGGNTNQQKTPRSKDRLSKRFKGEVEPDENDQLLLQSMTSVASSTTNEPLDDTSPNTSNNSASIVNTSGEAADSQVVNLEPFIKNVWQPPPKSGYDSFCWKCHESKVNLACSRCIRSYHAACAKVKVDNTWLCPDCTTLDNVLNSTKRSRRNELPLDLLSQLLSFALKRMRYAKGHYSFHMPYEEENAYKRIIVNPVTFDTLQAKVEAKEYRCADEFVNDTKWMLHNANILGFGNSTKTISATKAILKICRQEANEIETCAECYLNANTRTDWFVDVCSHPHLLLWAKLKGFPYWPAKAMSCGPHSLINVKFFGEHDRAFVPIKDCYLYSVQDPNTQTGKRAAKELADCIKEVGEHIERIISKVGGFSYAPYKTPYDPTDEMSQLENMMPGVQEFIKRQQGMISKPSLQFKIYKTADNNLSIIQKDLSTGELSTIQQQQQQQQDVDDFVAGSLKKRKGFTPPPALTDEKIVDNVSVSGAKYEVISKVTSDDNNSSKLSPVILKRKSTNGSEVKKTLEDECHELNLPKLARIDDKFTEQNSNNHTIKRKVDIGCAEKPKAKHSKPQELRIPILAIKTISINNEVNMSSHDVNKTAKEGSVVVKLQTPQPVDSEASQKVVQSLVKYKQGVTIKKIAKGMSPTNTNSISASLSSDLPTTTTSQIISSVTSKTNDDMRHPSPKSVEKQTDTNVVKEKTDEQKQRDEQNVNNILKGLIPFVEVKKEILSDKEEEQDGNEMTPTTTTITKAKLTDQRTTHAQIAATQMTSSSKDTPQTIIANESTNANLLLHVKEEVFSDADEIDDNAPLLPELTEQNSGQAVKPVNVKNVDDVRLVGDTIIQKLSNKNALGQHNNTNSANTNKRSTLKGIPYGPLPASALPKTCMQPLHNDASGIIPRAKKSFPQSSPPIDTLTSTSVNNSPVVTSSTATNPGAIGLANQNVDVVKRPLSRTTMVTIPVDFAATTQNSNSMGSMMSSIPVPPLTAVSKISSSGNAYNCMAHNAPATVTVSGTSGSLTTPSVVSLNSTTAAMTSISSTLTSTSLSSSTLTVAARKSPISSSLTFTSLSPSTLAVSARKSPITVVTYNNKSAAQTSSTIVMQNSKNALKMSTPPPLAGLSGSTLSNSSLANVTTPTETSAIPTTTNAIGSQTELLSGLVMPSLSTAVTDIINRGPPKLASKPRGPLQSEGYPMYASQAGPVSKLFVENAHKMTDYFISVMEDTIGEIAQGSEASLHAKVVLLEKELECTKQLYEQQTAEMERTKEFYELQITELRRTSDLMRISMENEKTRLVNVIRKQCAAERLRSVEETKRKQWCAQCRREANFYCCWNTSYCDYPCQQLHWAKHATNCAQTRTSAMESSTSNAATQNLHSSQTAHERHQTRSNNSPSTLNPPASYTAKSTVTSLSMSHSKKEKIIVKSSSSNNMMSPASATASSSLSATCSNNAPCAEVLKLPTNTYLRPVTSTSLSAQTLRCNTTYSIPVQRFNVPLPMTTHASTSGPHTFTIVRQGNGWAGPVHMANTATSSTIAAPIASVPPQGSTHRSGGPVLAATKNTKSQIRYH